MFDVHEKIGRNPYLKKQPDGSLRHEAELIGDRSVKFLEERSGSDGVKELVIIRDGRMIWSGPDIDKRHGVWSVTKSFTGTLGAMLVIFGIMLQAGFSLATIKLAAILLFLLLTSPTSSNALASAALLAGTRPMEDEQRDAPESTS